MVTRVVGYYQAWKSYNDVCTIDDINPKFCTHLIYAFAGIDDNNCIKVNDHWGDVQTDGYRRFNDLKKKNRKLKTFIAVGGWTEGITTFSNMASTPHNRRTFIQSCLKFLDQYKFDGIDLDWEYPSQDRETEKSRREDKENFTTLVKEMSAKLHREGYLLSAAVVATNESMETSYQVAEISKHLDFINVMTYDLHSASDGTRRVGHNAPLRSDDRRNVRDCIKAWLKAGADPEKLVVGVAAYGRAFTLADRADHKIGSRIKGPGNPETVDYSLILERIDSGWKERWDQDQKVPYIYKADQWIGYDDCDSVELKVKYVKKHDLGGIMMWSIDSDNPHGKPAFPLLRTIHSCIS